MDRPGGTVPTNESVVGAGPAVQRRSVMQPLASEANHSMNVDAFRSNLAATIAWCRQRFDNDHRKASLRSKDLQPSLIITSSNDLAPVHRAVNSLIDRRASILGPIDTTNVESDGRSFGFFVRQTLFDGVSEMETNGFINDTNTPPWDSWICMVDELLVSWVPPAMVEDVQLAIMCNAEECIAWLSDITDEPFVEKLRHDQLVW
jgi:hypothetical protein